MKKFVQNLYNIFLNFCVAYTCAVLIYPLLGAQGKEMRRGWLYEILLICLAAVLLQYAVFASGLLKRLSYLWRMALFAVGMLAVVSACAVGFQWFPPENAVNWLVFTGVFLAGFVAIALVFEAAFRLRRKVYDDALGRYKKGRAE